MVSKFRPMFKNSVFDLNQEEKQALYDRAVYHRIAAPFKDKEAFNYVVYEHTELDPRRWFIYIMNYNKYTWDSKGMPYLLHLVNKLWREHDKHLDAGIITRMVYRFQVEIHERTELSVEERRQALVDKLIHGPGYIKAKEDLERWDNIARWRQEHNIQPYGDNPFRY